MTQRLPAAGFLAGVRVLEVADELGEYAGKLLAGLGADVIKVEPPSGEVTRGYGPFYHDRVDTNTSLHFWHYNFGKSGVVLDLDEASGQDAFRRLALDSDVLLESRPKGYFSARGIGYESLALIRPELVLARITPFGDDGPWANYLGSDLIHLALGGVAMNCGYDPDPSGFYDTSPVAPQGWQAYQITGEIAVMGIIGALLSRQESGCGQQVSVAVHQAVSTHPDLDLPDWIFSRISHHRQTCRNSVKEAAPVIALTKDGRWMFPYQTYLDPSLRSFQKIVELLDRFGMAEDLHEPQYQDPSFRTRPSVAIHIKALIDRLVGRFLLSRELWRDAQALGLTWAPIRKPEENLADPHWNQRDTFIEVEHPELGKSITYIGAKWLCKEAPWRRGPRAPTLGEHTEAALNRHQQSDSGTGTRSRTPPLSPRGKPFAMSSVRVLDLCWLVATGGAGRFLASLGAEVIRIEYKDHLDPLRFVNPIPDDRMAGVSASTTQPELSSPNRSGFFSDTNAGKRAISLNLKQPRGRELLSQLIPTANVICEGFTPGTMRRLGFSYERLKELNPTIIYAQQSGMGEVGSYGEMRSYGPVAQAFSGLTEMSGLPDPFPPAGIGYSYLDSFGAYNLALAILAALYRQRQSGKGCWIDSSQVEAGTYLTSTAVLDFSVNGRSYKRTGNRSPYKPAAPHGIYRSPGQDRWIAIACFSEHQWQSLVQVFDVPAWATKDQFSTMQDRIANQTELDAHVESVTKFRESNALMRELQVAGVPAGVCQTAEDRYEMDPQLRHLNWLVELPQTEIGRWPARELPARLTETPSYQGGLVGRHGPNYAEDNDYVFGEILGLSFSEIRGLEAGGII